MNTMVNNYVSYGNYNILNIYNKLLHKNLIFRDSGREYLHKYNNCDIEEANIRKLIQFMLTQTYEDTIQHFDRDNYNYYRTLSEFLKLYFCNSCEINDSIYKSSKEESILKHIIIKDSVLFAKQYNNFIKLLNQELTRIADMRYEIIYDCFKVISNTIMTLLELNGYNIDDMKSISYYNLGAQAFSNIIDKNQVAFTIGDWFNKIRDIESIFMLLDSYALFKSEFIANSYYINPNEFTNVTFNHYTRIIQRYIITFLKSLRILRITYNHSELDLAMFINVDYNYSIKDYYLYTSTNYSNVVDGAREYIIIPIYNFPRNFTFVYYDIDGKYNDQNLNGFYPCYHTNLYQLPRPNTPVGYEHFKNYRKIHESLKKHGYKFKFNDLPVVYIDENSNGNEIETLLIESRYLYSSIYNNGNIESLDKVLDYYIGKNNVRETLQFRKDADIEGPRFKEVIT